MKTKEQILLEIQNAMTLNKDNVANCNSALSDAKILIMHETKELQNLLDEEYKRGINDTWEIARELCNINHDERFEIFGDSDVEHLIKAYIPSIIKEKIASYKEENELSKVRVGDVVQDNDDNTKATILDYDPCIDLDEKCWMVFTENGCVESWRENDFTKIGKFVDVCNVLLKKL